jgi:hypothetical protein
LRRGLGLRSRRQRSGRIAGSPDPQHKATELAKHIAAISTWQKISTNRLRSKQLVHYAKVDRWVAVLFGGMSICVLGMGAAFLAAGLGAGGPALFTAVGIASVDAVGGVLLGLALWGCYRITYEITPTDLTVRVGPFRTIVPLDRIAEVFPTRNPLSAPAPSLDRLQINYRNDSSKTKSILISPKDMEGFVRDLASGAPQLSSVTNKPLRLKAGSPA